MPEQRSIRYGALGLVAVLLAGLVWLGVVRYRADQRTRVAATPAEAVTKPAAEPPQADPKAAPGAEQVVGPQVPQPVAPIVVHVVGAVVNPGVYHLVQGDRVIDALNAAGGPVKDAALEAVNLARQLDDGEQVRVQTKEEAAAHPAALPASVPSGSSHGPASGGSNPKAVPAKVDVNTATAAQLEQLPGIGPKLASAIVEYRTQHGRFNNLNDLDKVSGIGSSLLKNLSSRITFN